MRSSASPLGTLLRDLRTDPAGALRPGEKRRRRWERALEWPLSVLAIVFLVVYALPILHPSLSAAGRRACGDLGAGIWAVYAADYAMRLFLAGDRRRFVRTNAIDLASVALPLIRPLRVIRVVRVLRLLDRRAARGLGGSVAVYVASTVTLVVLVSSLAVLDAERGAPGTNIKTFGDAVWWAMCTITTVGYGDRFPVTLEGRLVAVALMISGIALLGVVTAAFASWFVRRVGEEDRSGLATQAEMDLLLTEVRALREEVRRLRTPAAAGKPRSRQRVRPGGSRSSGTAPDG